MCSAIKKKYMTYIAYHIISWAPSLSGASRSVFKFVIWPPEPNDALEADPPYIEGWDSVCSAGNAHISKPLVALNIQLSAWRQPGLQIPIVNEIYARAVAPHAYVRTSLELSNSLRYVTGTRVTVLSVKSVLQLHSTSRFASDISPNSSLNHSSLTDNPRTAINSSCAS